MGLGNHVSVYSQLPRFDFVMATLVMCRHPALTAQTNMRSNSSKVPLPTLLHFAFLESSDRLFAMEAIEEVWPGLLSRVF